MCIDNSGSFDEIAARIIYCLCDVNTLKSSIIPEDNENSDDEVQNNSNNSAESNACSSADNNSNRKINDAQCISQNNSSNDSRSSKANQIQQLLFNDSILKPSINITDVAKLIALFDDNKYQNIEKCPCDFEDLISLFYLNDLN